MTSESSTPPLPSRQTLYLEFALVCALLWVPVLYSGIGDYMRWRKPSTLTVDEIYSVYSALAFGMLPIFLFWRNGEPLRKLGFRAFQSRDAGLALVLVLVAVVMRLAFRPMILAVAANPDAVTGYRIHHGFPWPVESIIYLVSAFREEIFYRAYLCSRLRDFGLNRTRTAILSALMFASVHVYQGWASLPELFFFGLIFAGVFLNYRALWPLIVAHASYNIILLASAR
jgi:membrane protease YdiL (CAAX protease family)